MPYLKLVLLGFHQKTAIPRLRQEGRFVLRIVTGLAQENLAGDIRACGQSRQGEARQRCPG